MTEQIAQDSAKTEATTINPADLPEGTLMSKFVKPDFSGRIVKFGKPILKTNEKIKETQENKKKFKELFLEIHYFENGDDIVYENYGGLRQYQQPDESFGGVVFSNPEGDAAVAVLFRKWCGQVKKIDYKTEGKDITLSEFIDGLEGLSAELTYKTGNVAGNDWQKNVVAKFVEGSDEQTKEVSVDDIEEGA